MKKFLGKRLHVLTWNIFAKIEKGTRDFCVSIQRGAKR